MLVEKTDTPLLLYIQCEMCSFELILILEMAGVSLCTASVSCFNCVTPLPEVQGERRLLPP